jgi:hypothetical protein
LRSKGKNTELGPKDFSVRKNTCGDKAQNLPCGRFCALVRAAAMFRQQAKPRGGAAQNFLQ